MKTRPKVGVYPIPDSVKKDIMWRHRILPEYNGVSMMAIEVWSQPAQIFATDASLNGCGGWNACSRQFVDTSFSLMITKQELHINCLEFLTIIVEVKIWGHEWSGKRIMIQCANMDSVTVMNSGRSKDPFLPDCLRELAYMSARH